MVSKRVFIKSEAQGKHVFSYYFITVYECSGGCFRLTETKDKGIKEERRKQRLCGGGGGGRKTKKKENGESVCGVALPPTRGQGRSIKHRWSSAGVCRETRVALPPSGKEVGEWCAVDASARRLRPAPASSHGDYLCVGITVCGCAKGWCIAPCVWGGGWKGQRGEGTYGHVGARQGRVPVGRDRPPVRVELDRLLAVEVDVAADRRTRSREREHRQGDRDGHVDADLAGVHLVLELARSGAARREDGRAVAVRVLPDDVNGLVEGVDSLCVCVCERGCEGGGGYIPS